MCRFRVLRSRSVPDEMYYVETGCEPWSVHAMKQDDECWPFELGPNTR